MSRRNVAHSVRASLPLIASIASALGSALALLLASRSGLRPEIAAYGAGMAVSSVTSAVLAGGMSLAFITGTDEVRADVLTARRWIVVPLLLLVSAGAAGVYGQISDLPLWPVFWGGITVAANLMAELDAALLQRSGRMTSWTAVTVVTRLAPVLAVWLLRSYAAPIAVCTVAYAVVLGVLGTRHRPRGVGVRHPVRAFRNAYRPGLATFTMADALALRLPLIVAPAVLAAGTAGVVTTLVSSQQTILGVLGSALYGSMAAQQNPDEQAASAHRRFDTLMTRLSVLAAVVGALAGPLFLWLLDVPRTPLFLVGWALLCCALPFATWTRMVQYRCIAADDVRRTTRSALLAVVGAAVLCVIAVPAQSSGAVHALCGCTLAAEVTACLYLWNTARERTRHA